MSVFLVVPQLLESVAEVPRELHWQIYLPALALSIVGMLPLMRMAERGGRPREMFLFGIGLMLVSVVLLGFARGALALYIGLWVFFVGFNYLEATLPSLVSKTAPTSDKGSALGMYSTCQFLGAFVGGAGGGWIMQTLGVEAVFVLSAVLVAGWLATASRMTPENMLGRSPLS